MCVRRFRPVAPFKEEAVRFAMMCAVEVLRHVGKREIVSVMDMSDISMFQLDALANMNFALYHCFPGCIDRIYIVDLPFLLKAGYWLSAKLFPENLRSKIQLVSRDEIFEMFGKNKMPDFIGGEPGPNVFYLEKCYMTPAKPISLQNYAEEVGLGDKATVKKLSKLLDYLRSIK